MLNYESDHWTPKRAKMLSYVAKHSKQRWTTKVISLRWIACIWHQNEQKCRIRSKTTQNNAKLQKWSKYNDLHRFDVKTIKATQNSKRDQFTMNLHRFDAKLQKWSKYNDLHRFDVKTIKTTQNCKRDQITMNLHRFDVKTI